MGKKRTAHHKRAGAACRELQALASAYIDNELTRALKLKIAGHLAECESCRQLINELEDIVKLARQLEMPVPEKASRRLRETIQAEMEADTRLKPQFEVIE